MSEVTASLAAARKLWGEDDVAWNFLARGSSATNAVESLNSLLADATAIDGAAGRDQVILAQQYLRWCENVEMHLQEIFADASLARGLFTNRHWHIRSIDPTTRMAVGMIQSEVREQRLKLEALRDQLQHYSSSLRPSPGEALVLLDTNVYVHGQPFGNVPWERLVGAPSARLIMPLIIVDELDKLKDRLDSARAVLRFIDSAFATATTLAPLPVRENVSLQIVDEPQGHVRLGRADDEIVRQAAYYVSVSSAPVTVITRDRGMRIRALAAGVDARMLPPGYERKKENV